MESNAKMIPCFFNAIYPAVYPPLLRITVPFTNKDTSFAKKRAGAL